MLKSVLYYLLFLTTSVRLVDLIYLLAKDSTNLPIPVFVVSSIMVIYGVVLVVKKYVSSIRLKQLLVFYLLQTGMIAFNLAYIALNCPLQISGFETLVVGTFLDLLVNLCLLYLGTKQIRGSNYFRMSAAKGQIHG